VPKVGLSETDSLSVSVECSGGDTHDIVSQLQQVVALGTLVPKLADGAVRSTTQPPPEVHREVVSPLTSTRTVDDDNGITEVGGGVLAEFPHRQLGEALQGAHFGICAETRLVQCEHMNSEGEGPHSIEEGGSHPAGVVAEVELEEGRQRQFQPECIDAVLTAASFIGAGKRHHRHYEEAARTPVQLQSGIT